MKKENEKLLDDSALHESTNVRYYSVYVECSNCGQHDRIGIECGTKVTDMGCPNCGCETLQRQT